MVEYDFGILLSALLDAGVEFIVVGGVSATLNGAPINIFDLDAVHGRMLIASYRFSTPCTETSPSAACDRQNHPEVKEQLNGEKDRAMRPSLRRAAGRKEQVQMVASVDRDS